MSQKACRNLYILYNIAEKPADTRGSAKKKDFPTVQI